MTEATLLISSKNYSSWSLRGFLLAKLSGISFKEERVSPGRPARARRTADAHLLHPRALPHPWRCQRVGHASPSPNTSTKTFPRRSMLPDRKSRARPLPLHLRRDAFRLRRLALLAADEPALPQAGLYGMVLGPGRYRPYHRHLARMPDHMERPVPVRQSADHRRLHVRPGGHALPLLRRQCRPGLPGILQHHPELVAR